jgi:hypothetical protein
VPFYEARPRDHTHTFIPGAKDLEGKCIWGKNPLELLNIIRILFAEDFGCTGAVRGTGIYGDLFPYTVFRVDY